MDVQKAIDAIVHVTKYNTEEDIQKAVEGWGYAENGYLGGILDAIKAIRGIEEDCEVEL